METTTTMPSKRLRKMGILPSSKHCHSPSSCSTVSTNSTTSTSATHFSWPLAPPQTPPSATTSAPPILSSAPPPQTQTSSTPTSSTPRSSTPPMSAPPSSPSEYTRLLSARTRLASRSDHLISLIASANAEMDLVRRKLCMDLQVMECLKEEIEKAGEGSMRNQLEEDFHNEYVAYVATLVRQKECVEGIQRRKQCAIRELEGIQWSDKVLEEQAGEYELRGAS